MSISIMPARHCTKVLPWAKYWDRCQSPGDALFGAWIYCVMTKFWEGSTVLGGMLAGMGFTDKKGDSP